MKFTLSCLMVFFSSTALSEDALNLDEIYRCDSLACPEQNSGKSDADSIDFKNPSNTMNISLQRITISTVNNTGNNSGGGGSARPNSPSAVEPSPQALDNKEIANPTPPRNKDVASSSIDSGYREAGFINGLPSNSNSVGVNDSYNPGAIQRDSEGSNNHDYYVDQNQVSYNPNPFINQSSPEGSKKKSQERKDPDTQSPSSFGNHSSGSDTAGSSSQIGKSNPTKSSQANSKSLLSKIAKQLGLDKFFGQSPNNHRSLGKSKRSTRKSSQRLIRRSRRNNKSGWDADLIRREFEAGKRDLASLPPGLGPKNMSIFLNICRHYHRYSKVENLPKNRINCNKR